jgi:hypothetical protein
VYPGGPETSVYFRTEELDGDVGWNWPLRIGFLPDDASAWLFDELETYVGDDKDWISPLVNLVRLDSETDSCDLLLIPTSIQKACEVVANLGIRISADCVVAMGPTIDYPWELRSIIGRLVLSISLCWQSAPVSCRFAQIDRVFDTGRKH